MGLISFLVQRNFCSESQVVTQLVIMSRLVIIAFIAKLTVPIHWSAVTVTAIRVTIVSSDIFVNIQLEVSYHRYLRIA